MRIMKNLCRLAFYDKYICTKDKPMENQLANELFNIIKGSGYKVKLFTEEGQKTTNVDEATRFYAYDNDLMLTLRTEDNQTEVVVQAGSAFDVTKNKILLNTIKKATHKNLGEFTVRKFEKKIEPKDFAHQSVVEGFSKPYGTVKTSYIQKENARLVIKHTKGVNEEVRGSRSRHIHSLFIENSQGERFKFPHRYMGGAKAMAMHVNEGGTPYDPKGEAILSICEEIASLNRFVRHVQSNKLVNENNSEIVDTVRSKLAEHKNTIHALSTLKGYNNFQVSENNSENVEKSVDISEKFLYNTFTTEELNDILGKVGRIVAQKQDKLSMVQETIKDLYTMIESQTDLGITLNENDPEHPANHVLDEAEILTHQLSYLATNVTNEQAKGYFNTLHSMVIEGVSANDRKLIEAIVKYLGSNPTVESVNKEIPLDEGVLLTLRKKLSS